MVPTLPMDVVAICQRCGVDPEVLLDFPWRIRFARPIGRAIEVHTHEGIYYLKKVNYPHSRLYQVYEAVERLAADGLAVSRFVRNRFAEPYILHESGNYYAVIGIDGHPPDLDDEKWFVFTAQQMGKWHAHAKAPQGVLLSYDRLDVVGSWRKGQSRLENYRERALSVSDVSEFDEAFLMVRDELDAQITKAMHALVLSDFAMLCKEAYQEGTLCHGSFVRRNLLIHDQTLAILDHDHMFQGPQVLDLATFLHRYAAQQRWDAAFLLQVLQAYESQRPFREGEWDLLRVLLLYPFGVMQVIDERFAQNSPVADELYLDRLEEQWEWNLMKMACIQMIWGDMDDSAWQDHTDERMFAQPSVAHASLRVDPKAPGGSLQPDVQITQQSTQRRPSSAPKRQLKTPTVRPSLPPGLWRP